MTAAEGQDETALGALQGLGLMGDPRGVSALLDALHNRNRQVVEVANGALHILTGHGEEMDVPGSRSRWQLWWEQNEHRFTPGLRYRDGELLGPHGFLERMDAFDPWTRRTAYDELVISSGCQLPFDSDGPWRVQRAHLRAWRRWVMTEGRDLTPGHWFLDGQKIG